MQDIMQVFQEISAEELRVCVCVCVCVVFVCACVFYFYSAAEATANYCVPWRTSGACGPFGRAQEARRAQEPQLRREAAVAARAVHLREMPQLRRTTQAAVAARARSPEARGGGGGD